MLECRIIEKHYGGVYALKGVSFDVRPGEVHALCGENGAGKSTLAKIIAGVVQSDAGEVWVNGEKVTFSSPAEARKLGIGIVFQELDLFEHLTVAENITLAHPEAERTVIRHATQDAFCRPFLRQVGLDVSPRTKLGDLSIAGAQLVAIARALSMKAKVLLLDEPTSSLTQEAAERLLNLIGDLKKAGTGIVYVSHKMGEIFRIADRVTVLRDGAHISTRPAAETSIEETIRFMVGREIDLASRVETPAGEVMALQVKGLRTLRLKEVNFSVRKGEILGVTGLVGSGRSALGEALFGLDPWTAGEVECLGKAYAPKRPAEAIQARFAYLPEDRRTQGLFLRMSVRRNASAVILPSLSRHGWIDFQREASVIQEELARTQIKMAHDALPVESLSGGNQQKVLLAKWLLTQPEVLYLDDPTRGVDIGAKADIYRIIKTLATEGKTILFVSSELPELLACSHRILVMNEGRSVALLETRATTQEEIMTLAANQPLLSS